MLTNLAGAVLANEEQLPPIKAAAYEYVIAGNGFYIRAEDSRMEAMIPVVSMQLNGLAHVTPYANLKTPKIFSGYLDGILASARHHMPNEALYQFAWDGQGWKCNIPDQTVSAASIEFTELGVAVIDLHSHGAMQAFYSATDDIDEQGLRFYLVIGHVDHEMPTIRARVGVYGHHWPVPVASLFHDNIGSSHTGPFFDLYEVTDGE